jgi:hypothetical protein
MECQPGGDRGEKGQPREKDEPRAVGALLHPPEEPEGMYRGEEWEPDGARPPEHGQQDDEDGTGDAEVARHPRAIAQVGQPLRGEDAAEEDREEEKSDPRQLAANGRGQPNAPGRDRAW